MTINQFFIGIPTLAVFVLAGYLLRELSTRKLTAEELGSLDKRLQPHRIRYIVAMVAQLLVFIAVRYSVPRLATVWFEIFLCLAALTTVGFEIAGWRNPALCALTRSFKVPFLASRILSTFGLLCLLAAMAATPFVDFKAH
jgi:uncharacterized membrane protein